jgi:ATP-dependent protease HslVU (ClpYQ) ATPase subunit
MQRAFNFSTSEPSAPQRFVRNSCVENVAGKVTIRSTQRAQSTVQDPENGTNKTNKETTPNSKEMTTTKATICKHVQAGPSTHAEINLQLSQGNLGSLDFVLDPDHGDVEAQLG